MDRDDFLKLVGVEAGKAESQPVAVLLRSGYACAGYYHKAVNQDLNATCVLINAQLIELGDVPGAVGRPTIQDFNEFLEEIAASLCRPAGAAAAGEDESAGPRAKEVYGRSIPLTAIPFSEISVVYPIAHIGALMKRAEVQRSRIPTFLDLNQSAIVALLRTKLW